MTHTYLRSMVIVLPLLLAALCGYALWSKLSPPDNAPQLRLRGVLHHNWRGPVQGACDVQLQLFDAHVNGTRIGDPLVLSNVLVDAGAFDVPVALDALTETASEPVWLGLAVRCADDSSFSALGPRLQHHTGASALIWEIPATGQLVCSLPLEEGTSHPTRQPTLTGPEYSLSGGLWLST